MVPKIIFANSICITLIFILMSYVSYNMYILKYDNLTKQYILKIDINKYPYIIFISLISALITYSVIYYIFGLYSFFNV